MAPRKPPGDDVSRETKTPDPSKVVQLRPGSGRGAGSARSDGAARRGTRTSTRTLTIEERRMTALALRTRGLPFTSIASAISQQYELPNYDRRRAHEDVRECIERISTQTVLEYVEESVARCMASIAYLQPKLVEGDPAAVQAHMSVERRLASLLGMDAAKRITVSGPDGGPVQVGVIPFTEHAEAVDAVDAIISSVLRDRAQ